MSIASRICTSIARIARSFGNAIMRFAMPKLYRAGSLGNPVRGDTKAAQPSPEDLARMAHGYEPDDHELSATATPSDPEQKGKERVRAAGFIC